MELSRCAVGVFFECLRSLPAAPLLACSSTVSELLYMPARVFAQFFRIATPVRSSSSPLLLQNVGRTLPEPWRPLDAHPGFPVYVRRISSSVCNKWRTSPRSCCWRLRPQCHRSTRHSSFVSSSRCHCAADRRGRSPDSPPDLAKPSLPDSPGTRDPSPTGGNLSRERKPAQKKSKRT